MIRPVAVLAAGLVAAGPLAAQDTTGLPPCDWIASLELPEDVVSALYETTPALPERCLNLSNRLATEFAAEEARRNARDEPIGRVSFGWVVNGQDYLISNVRIQTYEIEDSGPDDPKRQIVTARFDNFGEPQVIDYFFAAEDGRWALEEVASRGSGLKWVLSLMLRYGHIGGDVDDNQEEEAQ